MLTSRALRPLVRKEELKYRVRCPMYAFYAEDAKFEMMLGINTLAPAVQKLVCMDTAEW